MTIVLLSLPPTADDRRELTVGRGDGGGIADAARFDANVDVFAPSKLSDKVKHDYGVYWLLTFSRLCSVFEFAIFVVVVVIIIIVVVVIVAAAAAIIIVVVVDNFIASTIVVDVVVVAAGGGSFSFR